MRHWKVRGDAFVDTVQAEHMVVDYEDRLVLYDGALENDEVDSENIVAIYSGWVSCAAVPA